MHYPHWVWQCTREQSCNTPAHIVNLETLIAVTTGWIHHVSSGKSNKMKWRDNLALMNPSHTTAYKFEVLHCNIPWITFLKHVDGECAQSHQILAPKYPPQQGIQLKTMSES